MNRINKISTGWKSTSSTLVEMKVVPQITMVSRAARWPRAGFVSTAVSSSLPFLPEQLPAGPRRQAGEGSEIVGEMALIGKACLHGGLCRGDTRASLIRTAIR